MRGQHAPEEPDSTPENRVGQQPGTYARASNTPENRVGQAGRQEECIKAEDKHVNKRMNEVKAVQKRGRAEETVNKSDKDAKRAENVNESNEDAQREITWGEAMQLLPKNKGPRDHDISIYNVNGVRAIQKKKVLESHIITQDPDIICLNELKASLRRMRRSPHNPEHMLLKRGYNHIAWHCMESENIGYSGIGVASKVPWERYHKGWLPAVGAQDTEARVLNVFFEKYILVHVYAPVTDTDPASTRNQKRTLWNAHMQTHLRALRQEDETKRPVVLCGDLNVTMSHADVSPEMAAIGVTAGSQWERDAMKEIFAEHDLVDAISVLAPQAQGRQRYTWYRSLQHKDREQGLRIDMYAVTSALASSDEAMHISDGL